LVWLPRVAAILGGVTDSVWAVSPGREREAIGGGLLAEVSEAQASGPVAEIYDDIRRVFGVTFVVFVYRALAVDAARLAAAWEAVRPNLLSGETHRLARRLGVVPADAVESLPEEVLSQSWLDRQLLAETLVAFHRVNTRNALVLAALRDGHAARTPPPRSPAPPDAARPILPMADLGALSASVSELLRTMSEPMTGGREPIVIPSLLRYLARDEHLLRAVWTNLRPILRSHTYARHVAAKQREVDESSRALPYSVARCGDADAQRTISSFLRTIPAMIVTAPMLAASLGLDPSAL
jgi:hypothetical protein